MQNFVQAGAAITVTAAAAASSGDVVKIGNLIGIAQGSAATGEELVLATYGVFELPKVAADALAVGDPVYWRSSDGLVTGTATGNSKLGVAVSDAGVGSAGIRVRLNGAF